MTTRTVAKGRVGLHRNRWHQYAFSNSDWQTGTTTILRLQDAMDGSDGLVTWAAKLAAKAAFDSAIRQPQNPSWDDALVAALAAVDEPRNKGTRVHGGIEAAITGEEHLPTEADGKIWYHFTRFLLRERPEIHASEQMVINLSAGYGGTLDLDATVRGKRSLIDVKTGKMKPSHVLQLAAYSGAEFSGVPDDPEKYPVGPFEAHYVLLVNDDGYELVPLTVGAKEIEHFLFLAETYKKLKAWAKEAA